MHSTEESPSWSVWLLKKFPTSYTTWRSINASITAHPTFYRSILVSYHLHLSLAGSLISSGFPTKVLYAPLLSSPHAPCATTISFFFNCSPEYLVGNTSHKAALQGTMWCYIHKMWQWLFVFPYATLWGKRRIYFRNMLYTPVGEATEINRL